MPHSRRDICPQTKRGHNVFPRYRVRPSRNQEGEIDAPLKLTLLYGKTAANVLICQQIS